MVRVNNWHDGNQTTPLTLPTLSRLRGRINRGESISSNFLGSDPTGVINGLNTTGCILLLATDITLSADDDTDFGNIIIMDAGGSITTPTGRTTTINKLEGEGYMLKGVGDYTLNTPFVIPEWFGATGDGATDDTASFVTMIASTPLTNFEILLNNNYKISSIEIDSKSYFSIKSNAESKINHIDAAVDMIYVSNCDNFKISGFEVLSTASTSGNINTGIEINNSTDGFVFNVKSYDFSTGVLLSSCDNVVVSNCYSEIAFISFSLNSCNNCVMQNSTSKFAHYDPNEQVPGIKAAGYGFVVDTGFNNVVRNCQSFYAGDDGFRVNGSTPVGDFDHTVIFENCNSYSPRKDGFRTSAGSNIAIINGNVFESGDTSYWDSSTAFRVPSSVVYGYLSTASNVTIQGGKIQGSNAVFQAIRISGNDCKIKEVYANCVASNAVLFLNSGTSGHIVDNNYFENEIVSSYDGSRLRYVIYSLAENVSIKSNTLINGLQSVAAVGDNTSVLSNYCKGQFDRGVSIAADFGHVDGNHVIQSIGTLYFNSGSSTSFGVNLAERLSAGGIFKNLGSATEVSTIQKDNF